ncbi:hypothetical protein K7X08_024456 [Anisodus acutangulus]|uniref:Peroxisomal membrane protein PEX14 n=1 Tax=Anisodus acutangulus TaxID=402998 RepID=A0A9Q1RFZ5_9SOLA|nr:hypothetical protein K7X08_024456 [Anisodus acutangulus]
MKSMSSALQKLEDLSSALLVLLVLSRGSRGNNRSTNQSLCTLYPPRPHVVGLHWPWKLVKVKTVQRNFHQSQGSGDGMSYGYQDNLTNGDSSTPWWQRKNSRITEIEAENEQKFGSTAAPTEVRPVQRSWVPPQPPPVAMPEVAAAIRQPKKPLFQKEKLVDDELMACSSEISDDLQRITKISESGGLTEADGSNSGQQLNEAPIITNGDSVLSS